MKPRKQNGTLDQATKWSGPYRLDFHIEPRKPKETFQDENGNACFSLKTASEKLGWSPITLRARLLDGSIKGNKIGRKWFILASEIEGLLTGTTNKDNRRNEGN